MIVPEGLHAALKYVAKSAEKYVNDSKKETYQALFAAYEKQLSDWIKSQDGMDKCLAVLTYVQKGTLIDDLINYKIFEINNGVLSFDKKNLKVIFDSIIAWTVEEPGNPRSNLWEELYLQNSWIAFQEEQISNKRQNVMLCTWKRSNTCGLSYESIR